MAKKWQFRITHEDLLLGREGWADVEGVSAIRFNGYTLHLREVEIPPGPKYKVGDSFGDRDWAVYTITGPAESRFGDDGEHDGYDYPMLVKAIGTKAVWHDYWSERSLGDIAKTN